jgi:hypothetical protein
MLGVKKYNNLLPFGLKHGKPQPLTHKQPTSKSKGMYFNHTGNEPKKSPLEK